MKLPKLLVPLLGAGLFLAVSAAIQGQAPVPPPDPAVRQVIADIQAQHKTMGENQTKIEELLEKMATDVHQLRIYSSRSGGKG